MPKSLIARLTASLSALAIVAILGAVAWQVWLDGGTGRLGPGQEAGQEAGRSIGGPFELTDTQGETVTVADLRGAYALVFFGYTHCPDVCPMTLTAMTRALEAVADRRPEVARQVTPVFITVDPARDDVARMRDYLRNFHPRMIGLTGSEQAIAEAAEAYHVSYSKVDPEEVDPEERAGQAGAGGNHAGMDHGRYLMQHSSYVYLMGPEGRHLAHVAHQAGAPRIAEMIRSHVAR